MDCTISIAKTKALISCTVTVVTAQLICVFVFTYVKSRFSHNEANLMIIQGKFCIQTYIRSASAKQFYTGCSSSVGSDASWDARGTWINPRI